MIFRNKSVSASPLGLACALVLSQTAFLAHADLVLETETAELGKRGDQLISTAIQYEREKDGSHAWMTVNQYEIGVTDRAELLIEPFFYEWDHPKGGKNFSGVGDLEITPSYMVLLERPMLPAVVLALKIKVPTATNRDIGSGELDYYPYLIFGKTTGDWVFNANFGVDFIKSPHDEPLRDQYIWDFSAERRMTPNWSIYAEAFGNSRPAVGEDSTVAGALATEYRFSNHINAFVSVGYDTDQLLVIRPGFNIEF